MNRSSLPGASIRTGYLAALTALPFAGAIVLNSDLVLAFLLALLGPAAGAAAMRWLRAWPAWGWVGLTVAVGAGVWGWIEWVESNAHCETATPLIPALTVSGSAIVAAAVGAWVTGTGGSAGRAFAGGTVAALLFAVLAVASQFALPPLGMPSLIAHFSHC